MTETNWWILGPLIAVVAPVLFALYWCLICVMIARLGGWSRLARDYALTTPPPQAILRGQSLRMGFFSYNRSVRMAAGDAGLYLATFPLFRAGHPPLLLPWSAVSAARTRRLLLVSVVELTIEATPRPVRLQIVQGAAEHLQLARFIKIA
jgi:hypothetical protein